MSAASVIENMAQVGGVSIGYPLVPGPQSGMVFSPGETWLDPGQPLGSTIRLAVAAGYLRFRLGSGRYYLDEPLDGPSGLSLEGLGSDRTEIFCSLSRNVALADDPTNYQMGFRGAIDTSYLSTTLSANAPRGATTIAVVSAGTLKAGQWVRLHGHNSAAGDTARISGGGANVTLTEIVQVDRSYAGGLNVPLAWPLQQAHAINNGGAGAACVVTGVVPIERVTLAGFRFTNVGGIANGILFDFATGIEVDDIRGTGFSRFILESRLGCRDFSHDRLYGDGNCNGVAMYDSAMSGRVGSIRSSPSGKIAHDLGIPRGGVVYKNRCSSMVTRDVDIRRMVRAGWVLGGIDMTWTTVHGQDTDLTEAAARDANNALACFWQYDTSPLADVEFGIAHSYGTMTWDNCRQTLNSELQCALLLHDCYDLTIGSVRGANNGLDPNTAPFAGGVWIQDAAGTIGSMLVEGCNNGLQARGGFANMVIGVYEYDGASGSGINGNIAYLINTSGVNALPRIGLFRYSNVVSPFVAGADWLAGVKDWTGVIPLVDADGVKFSDAVIAFNPAGANPGALTRGDLVSIDPASPAGTRQLIDHAGANHAGAVAITTFAAANNYLLVSVAPLSAGAVLCTAAAVGVGDILEASGVAKQALVNNAATVNRVGKALVAKGAGAGVVQIGPA